MAALGDFFRRAWLPLTTLVVVAGLTALAVQLRAGDEGTPQTEVGAEQPQQGGRTGGPGARQAGPGRSGRGGNSDIPRDARLWPWWNDEEVKRELGLTDEFSERVEGIYQARVNRMRPYAAEHRKEEMLLNQMVRERTASPEMFEIQASKLESLNAELRKSRWVMLYRLYRELEPEQYQKLREIWEQRLSRGRGGSNR